MTAFPDQRDDFPLPQKPIATGSYALSPAATVPQGASSWAGRAAPPRPAVRLPASLGLATPPQRATRPAPSYAPQQGDPLDEDVLQSQIDAWRSPQEPSPLTPEQLSPRREVPEGPAPGGSFDQFVDRAYGMSTGPLGTHLMPANTEPSQRRFGSQSGQEQAPGFFGDTAAAAQQGIEGMTESLAGLGGMTASVVGADERAAAAGRFVDIMRARAGLEPEHGGGYGLYLGAVRAIPQLAGMIGTAAITGGTAPFLMVGGALGAGRGWNEGYAARRQQGMSERDAARGAIQEGIVGAATEIVANAVTADAFGVGATKAVKEAVAAAGTREAVAGMLSGRIVGALNGASANVAAGFGSTVAQGFLANIARRSEPEFDRWYEDHPEWASQVLKDAIGSMPEAAVVGALVGAVMHGKGRIDAERAVQSAPELRALAERFGSDPTMTPQKAQAYAEYLAAREGAVAGAMADDAAWHKVMADAVDMSRLDEDTLGRISRGEQDGVMVPVRGTDDLAVATPVMALAEIAERARATTHPVVPLDVSGGAPTKEAVDAWVDGSRARAEEIAKQRSLSRAQMDRIAGRRTKLDEAQRKAFLEDVRRSLAEPPRAPKPAPRQDTSARVGAEIASLPPLEKEMVLRGLSPQTARKVMSMAGADATQPGFMPPVDTQRRAAGGKETVFRFIAERSGVDAKGIREVPAPDGLSKVVEFGKERGLEVRFFESDSPVSTAGSYHDGTMWINAAAKGESAAWAVAVHETFDALHRSDPALWHEFHDLLRERAPEALAEAERRYGIRYEAQAAGGKLTPEELSREGASSVAEAMFDAFGLHAAAEGGRIDRSKVRALVDAAPGLFARLLRALRGVLRKVGLSGRETGMNDAQAERIERAMGRNELHDPAVRRLVAEKMADVLERARIASGSGADGPTQSIADEAPRDGETGPAPRIVRTRRTRQEIAEQRRIDLSYEIGRRAGLLSGQVEGQRQGRKDQAKEDAKAQRLRDKATKEIRRLATDAVRMLPKSMRGDYLVGLRDADTFEKVHGLATEVARDMTMIPLHDLRADARRAMKALRSMSGLANEAKETARTHLEDAVAMLSGEDGKAARYVSPEDSLARLSAAEQMVAAAQNAIDESVADYKAAQAARAAAIERDAKATGDALASMKPLPEDGIGGHRRTVTSKLFAANANADVHTLEAEIGGALPSVMAGIRDGAGRVDLRKASVTTAIDRELRAAGFEGAEDYARRAGGEIGNASTQVVKGSFGGTDVEIPLGKALAIAAMDADTYARLGDGPENKGPGIVLSSRKGARTYALLKSDVDAIRSRIEPRLLAMAERIKEIVEEETYQDAADAHFRLRGRQAKKVEGYFPAPRVGDALAMKEALSTGDLTAVTTEIGSFKDRTGSAAPFQAMDFMDAIDETVDGNLFMAHLAEPGQHAMRVLRSEPVRNGIERAYGEDMNASLRSLVLNGVRLTGKPTGDVVERINGLVSGAKVMLSPAALMRQYGGMSRAASEMPAGALAKGVSRMAAMGTKERAALADRMMGANGYFSHRWSESQVGIYAGIMGERASGKEMARQAAKAMMASLSAVKDSAAKGRIVDAARHVVHSGKALAKFLRSFEQLQRGVDRHIGTAVFLGHDAELAAENPSMPEETRFRLALARTETTFRRTQNVSDPLDDTMFAAKGRQDRGATRLLFPFSSDPLKAYNQARRAVLSGNGEQMRRTSAAIGVNAAWSAGVMAARSAAVLGAAGAFTSDDPRRRAGARAEMKSQGKQGLLRLAGDVASTSAGYPGMFFSDVAQAVLMGDKPDPASSIMAFRTGQDLFAGIIAGDGWKAAGAASELAGIPLAAPARDAAKIYRQAVGDPAKAQKEMSSQVRSGEADAQTQEAFKEDRAQASAAARAYRTTGRVTEALSPQAKARIDAALARRRSPGSSPR